LLDRSQSANLFDPARPASEAARDSTQPLPRLEPSLPPRPRRPRAPHASLASRFQGRGSPRLAAIASAARRQARFLPGAIVVLVLLTHPGGCGRSSTATPAPRAAVSQSRPAAPIAIVKQPPPQAAPRARLHRRRAPRGLAHRRARVLSHDSPAPAPAPAPVASSAHASTPVPTYVHTAPSPSYARPEPSYTPPEPSASRSDPSGEFGFEAPAAHQ
jgi:hypothetical protein